MKKKPIIVFFLFLCLLGASCDKGGSSSESIGSMRLPIILTQGTTSYWLHATFHVTGPQYDEYHSTSDVPDGAETLLIENLNIGSYQVQIEDGWYLERDDGTGWETVSAELVSGNPINVEVRSGTVSEVIFLFNVDSGIIGGEGISIGYDIVDHAPEDMDVPPADTTDLDPAPGDIGGELICLQPPTPLFEITRGRHGQNAIDLDCEIGDALRNPFPARALVVSAVDAYSNGECYDTEQQYLDNCSADDACNNIVKLQATVAGVSYMATLLHLSSVSVSVGDIVEPFDIIGECGNVGWTCPGASDGSHVHFALLNVDDDTFIYPGELLDADCQEISNDAAASGEVLYHHQFEVSQVCEEEDDNGFYIWGSQICTDGSEFIVENTGPARIGWGTGMSIYFETGVSPSTGAPTDIIYRVPFSKTTSRDLKVRVVVLNPSGTDASTFYLGSESGSSSKVNLPYGESYLTIERTLVSSSPSSYAELWLGAIHRIFMSMSFAIREIEVTAL